MKLTELRAMLERATPRPWVIHAAPKYHHIKTSGGAYIFEPGCQPRQRADAALIVALVNAAPRLLAVVGAAKRHALAVEGDDRGQLSGERRDITMRDLLMSLKALEDA